MPEIKPQADNPVSNAIARASSALAALLGCIALIGWIFNLPMLANLGPAWIPMAPSTALLLILFGSAMYSAASLPANRAAHWIGIGIGSFGTLLALLLFFLSFQGIRHEAEHFGLSIAGTLGEVPLGHISPLTALCLFLAGLSLLAGLRPGTDRAGWAKAGFCLAFLLALVSIVFLVAYLIGTPLLYGGNFIPPALTSIIALTALSAGLLTLTGSRARAADRQTEPGATRASPLFFVVFALLAIGLVMTGAIYHRQHTKAQRAAVERELNTIADLKVSELNNWRADRLEDAALLYGNPVFTDLAMRSLGSKRDAQAEYQLHTWLRKIREAYGYTEVFLIDAKGVARFSDPGNLPTAAELETARLALLTGKASLSDFHRHTQAQPPHLSLLVPILDPAAGGRPLGIVMMEIDPGKSIYPLLQRWVTISPSAETLLVRRDGDDVQYLNELKYWKNAALSLRYPLSRTDLPAVKAVLGQRGIVEGTDYRGEQVIAALRAVPDTPWLLVARMDKAEILGSSQEALWLTAGFVVVMILATGLTLLLIGRRQRERHYQERTRAAEALARGAARYQAVTQTALDGIVTADRAGTIIDWNSGAEHMFGYAASEIVGQPLTLLMPERLRAQHLDGMKRIRAGGGWNVIGKTVELAGRRKDASEFPLEMSLTQWAVGDEQFFTGTIHDITGRKAAEAKILRHTQLYTVLSQCNKAIVHCTSEEALFNEVCRAAVEFNIAKLAWVGILDTGTLQIKPAASFGDATGYLKDIDISADAGSLFGRGPTSTAMREKQPFWCQDFQNEPVMAPWRELATRHNLAAAAALPLLRGGVVIGVFNLYSSEADAFDELSRNLLLEMSADIGFALDNFTREAQRKQMEESLRAAEEQFRGLVEQSISGIYIIQDGKFAYVNPRFAEIRGFSVVDELIGQDPLPWIAEKDRSTVAEYNRRLLAGEKRDINYSFTALCKDGSSIEVGVHSSRASYRGRPAIIGMLQDISEKKRAEEAIQHYIEQLKSAFMSTVEVATTLSELRDPYTAGHERRVGELAVALGAELSLNAQQLEGLRVAGYLHDIGKTIIPSEILSKPGKLSTIEFQLIQGHAQASYDVLKTVKWPWPVAEIALQHHERMDGSGYPQGLKGEAILFEARILAVADVVEAMSSHRPYRAGLGVEKALTEIERGRETVYDTEVADACLKLFREKAYKLPE